MTTISNSTKPIIYFAGTPEFAALHLQTLIDNDYLPSLIFTQPDRPAGRGKKLQQSPVKQIASQYNIDIIQVEKLKTDTHELLQSLPKPDLLIVVAYGLILPQWLLDLPKFGAINVHASLLPRWRGAAPIQRAIEHGDKQSGVCIMQMDAGLDTGDILSSATVAIDDKITSQQLHDELLTIGKTALIAILPTIFSGKTTPIKQSEIGVTYAKKLKKSEALINWIEDAQTICAKIRAFNPTPIAFSYIDEVIYRIYSAAPAEINNNAASEQICGQVIAEDKANIYVQTGDGIIAIDEIQEVGKKRLTAAQFLNGKSLLGKVMSNVTQK